MTDPNLPGIKDIAEMVAILKEGGWRSATLKVGDFELSVSDGDGTVATASGQAPAAPAAAPSAPAPAVAAAPSAPAASGGGGVDAVEEGEGLVIVRAETLGAFWRSPQPGAPSFIEVGDEVDADTPLAIIEVMKMMTRITPGVAGMVVAIHVENGDLIEFGQPLVTIATS